MSRDPIQLVQQRYDRLARAVDRLRVVVKQRESDEQEYAAMGQTYSFDDLLDAEKEVDACLTIWKRELKKSENYTA